MEEFKKGVAQFISTLTNYAPKIVIAFVILFIGIWVIKHIVRQLKSVLVKMKIDLSLIPFFTSSTRVLLYIMLLLTFASIIGLETTSFIALLGAAGLAIGLALQGSLTNFAGGVLILIFKPFKIGDFILSNGVTACVNEIRLFHTVLHTFDNRIVILPNGVLSNNMIINYSKSETRLVEWVFCISYADNIEFARKLIENVIFTDSRVINKSAPFIKVSALADNSVNLLVRAEVLQKDYWDVLYLYNEKIKMRFDKEGIHFPFPQHEVHLSNSIENQLLQK